VEIRLEDYLEKDERLLWRRLPSGGQPGKTLVGIQIVGHAVLTAMAVFFAMAAVFPLPVHVGVKVTMAVILCVAMNGPLVVWTMRRGPRIRRGGDALCFVTEQRVGSIRASGELRQVPIHQHVKILIFPSAVAIKLGDTAEVTFGGLTAEERKLVQTLVASLVRKARAEAGEDKQQAEGDAPSDQPSSSE